MKDNFTYGVKLNFLEDCLTLFTFDVNVYKVCFIGIHQFPEQNHWRTEMNLVISSIQYTRYKTFVPKFLGISLAEICSFIPYNLNSFHNGMYLNLKVSKC